MRIAKPKTAPNAILATGFKQKPRQRTAIQISPATTIQADGNLSAMNAHATPATEEFAVTSKAPNSHGMDCVSKSVVRDTVPSAA